MTYVQVLLAGGLVGVLYGALRVTSPAPPPVPLFGLLGMVLGQSLLEAASCPGAPGRRRGDNSRIRRPAEAPEEP
ncbi:DUF1427 family protein [Streptomyces sp. NPDC052687]|uniref:DUF1427 family protein n=1 Tax=Streptomyces sp. NPDC052687 TaxID=3154759 RepID=UPI00341E1FBA